MCIADVYSKYASVRIQEKMRTFKKHFVPFLNLREAKVKTYTYAYRYC